MYARFCRKVLVSRTLLWLTKYAQTVLRVCVIFCETCSNTHGSTWCKIEHIQITNSLLLLLLYVSPYCVLITMLKLLPSNKNSGTEKNSVNSHFSLVFFSSFLSLFGFQLLFFSAQNVAACFSMQFVICFCVVAYILWAISCRKQKNLISLPMRSLNDEYESCSFFGWAVDGNLPCENCKQLQKYCNTLERMLLGKLS